MCLMKIYRLKRRGFSQESNHLNDKWTSFKKELRTSSIKSIKRNTLVTFDAFLNI